MARPLRIEMAGGRYHLTARGNERRNIFRDDRDRRHFLELLSELPGRFGTLIHSYALLDNHYHLVVETPESNLSRTGQWLNVSYGVWFNRRHGRSGHLFQGRFKSHLIEDDSGLMEVTRYVHLNPVRIGRLGLGKEERARQRTAAAVSPGENLVHSRLKTLREYQWSSCGAYLGWVEAPVWLHMDRINSLAGGRTRAQQREALRRHVEEPIREGMVESPWERLIGGAVLGSKEFVEKVRDRIKGDRREQKELRKLQAASRWEEIVKAVEGVKGEAWELFRDRHGDWGRDAALYLGRVRGRLKLSELAEKAGGMEYAAVGAAVSRVARQIKEAEVRSRLAQVEAQLAKG